MQSAEFIPCENRCIRPGLAEDTVDVPGAEGDDDDGQGDHTFDKRQAALAA